jgi:restriction endonuclease S subunit
LKITLAQISDINTGVFSKPISKGEIVYLQSKHFDENGVLKQTLQPDLKADKINEKHLLKDEDVLFAAKGTKNFAALYEDKNQPSVASTSFFVIRLHQEFKKIILPAYLAWLINHSDSQKYLKGKAIGTSMVSISKAVLGSFQFSIPPIKTQKAILQITNLRHKEKKLQHQITVLREQQIQQQIINSIK